MVATESDHGEDDEHLPAGFASGTTFHPTFLYESLWNVGLCLALVAIDRRLLPSGGRLLAVYVLGYGVGRFWIEGLRIDRADRLGPLRWNQWVALGAIAGALALLLVAEIRSRRRTAPEDAATAAT